MSRVLTRYIRGLVFLVMVGAAFGVHGAKKSQPIRFGSVAMDTPAVMQERLKPLTSYLSESLGQPVVLKLAPDMASAIDDVSKGNVELAYLTPVAYIRSNAGGKTHLVAKTITKNRPSFQLMIVVREDSPIRHVEDLQNKTFAFGDPAALLQRAVVVGAGMELEQLGEHHFLGHYDNIVRGVLNKDFDAGILKDTMAFKWKNNGVRIIYNSPHLPPYNIAAAKHVKGDLFDRLQQAFLSLNVDNPEHREVIKALDKKYDGFAPTNDAEYDVVRQLIQPFRKD